MDRRQFLQQATLAGASLATAHLASAAQPARPPEPSSLEAYTYRIAFGAWINDMRSDPVPLTDWPAHQFDECTVDSALEVMDLLAETGCKYLDAFGLWATRAYPLDIISAFQDSQRAPLLSRLFQGADQRGVRMFLPLGLMTWGYDEIIAKDPEVRRRDGVANPSPSAMCGAREKSWYYIEKIIDTAMQQYPFAGIHMESADQGYCACAECAGGLGVVGYNAKLNARCADYVKSKYPGTITMTIPINWLPGAMPAVGVTPRFNAEEMGHIIDLSKHIDIFMDQGHQWTFTPPERIRELHCAYGTSGGRWLYHSARYDRLAFFVPNPRETVANIRQHHTLGEIRYQFNAGERLERMRRCLIVTCHLLNTVMAAKGEPGWN